jgi:hypothetical protein
VVKSDVLVHGCTSDGGIYCTFTRRFEAQHDSSKAPTSPQATPVCCSAHDDALYAQKFDKIAGMGALEHSVEQRAREPIISIKVCAYFMVKACFVELMGMSRLTRAG